MPVGVGVTNKKMLFLKKCAKFQKQRYLLFMRYMHLILLLYWLSLAINSAIFSLQKPDLVILVIDGNIGQHAFDHRGRNLATAFTQSVDIGAVIVSKMAMPWVVVLLARMSPIHFKV